jgi:hypothetical protein
MPTSRRVSLLALVAILAVSAAYAQKPSARPQEVFAPYWTSESGWDTELQLKNNLSSGSLTVTPVLRLASGEEIPLDPVTILSNMSTSVWVNEGLLKHSPSLLSQPGSYGSVVFRFTSFSAMNLYATVVPSIPGEPIAFPVRARPAPKGEAWVQSSRSGSLEGIWWQPRSGLKDVLAISNSSQGKINGTLSLFDAGGKHWSEPLSFAPYQTQRMSISDLLLKAGLSGSYGGIELNVPASARALAGVHFMYDEASQFSASLEMFSRDPNATIRERTGADATQWTLRAPMLALSAPDPVLGLPAGIALQPNILVRNTTANKISANIILSWRGDSTKGQVKLPGLDLAPFATQQLQIGAMQGQLGIPNDAHWALATLTATASPDDLVAIASSRDNSGRYHVDTEFSGTVTRHFVGGEWRYDSGHNQIVSVTNSGQKPADALLTVHYDGGEKTYEMQQRIQPGDEIVVNFADLIHNRVSDRKGNVLPADLAYGTYDVKDLSSGHGSLSVGALVLDKTWGYRAAVPSPDCCGFGSPLIDPSAVDLSVGGFETVGVDALDQCTNEQESIFTNITSWWSGNTAIAQVAKGQVTGVTAGTTTANGSGEIIECSGNTEYFQDVAPSAPVTVQVPNSLSVLSVTVLPDGPGPPDGCPASLNYGIKIDIKYQVLDQNGAAIQSAGMTPYENGTFFTGGGYSGNIGPVPGYPTSSLTTAADGTFHDVPLGICQAYPIGSAGLTSLQHITIIMPDGSAPGVRTQTFTVTAPGSQSFGHGSISNSIGDISATR